MPSHIGGRRGGERSTKKGLAPLKISGPKHYWSGAENCEKGLICSNRLLIEQSTASQKCVPKSSSKTKENISFTGNNILHL